MSTTVPATSMFAKVWRILVVSRPPSWTFGPILFGIGVIHSRVIPKTFWSLFLACLQIAALSIPLSIIVFGINDVYDYQSDVRNPRKISNGLEGGILPPEFHKDVRIAAYISTIFIILSAAINQRRDNFIATCLLVLFGWQYSALPLRLKEVPVLDSLCNGLIVYLAWFCGFGFSGSTFLDTPGKGLMLSLCTSGIHALGAVVDTDADRASGQRTIAVVLGERPAALFAAFCYFLSSLTVDFQSIFGVYIYTGLSIMLVPCLHIGWAHRAFQAIVYLSITTAVFWIGLRVWSVYKGMKLD